MLPVFLEHLTMLPILMVASYFTADFIFPNFFYNKRYTSFVVILIFSCFFFVLIMRTYLFFFFFPKFYPEINIHFPHFLDFNVFQHVFYIYSTVAIFVMIKYIRRVNKIEKQRGLLEKQNLSSELAILRSQVSPHFLFNTLNNINALIKKDPDKTYNSIIRLSEIMRYMLYDAKNDSVLLEKEIEYLKSYIGLLLLRVESNEFIKFQVNGEPNGIMIAPMLFVPLLENAFKHGNKDVESPGISVDLTIINHSIFFEVTNYLNKNSELVDSTNGIGIPNLERRLALLYPNSYNFSLRIVDDKHFASLSIKLK
jgi:two-component system LytT family sensor kinase